MEPSDLARAKTRRTVLAALTHLADAVATEKSAPVHEALELASEAGVPEDALSDGRHHHAVFLAVETLRRALARSPLDAEKLRTAVAMGRDAEVAGPLRAVLDEGTAVLARLDAQRELEDVLGSTEIDAVSAAVATAQAAGVDAELVAQGEAVLHVLCCSRDLVDATAGADINALEEKLAIAEGVVDAALVERGTARLAELRARARVAAALAAEEIEELRAALDAAELTLGLEVEGRARLAQLQAIQCMEEAVLGDEIAALDATLATAKELGVEQAVIDRGLYRRQQLVLQFAMQDAIALAVKHKHRELKDLLALRERCAEAEAGGVDPAIVEKGRDKAEEVRLTLLPGIVEELEMAIEGVRPEEVEDALERATAVGASPDIIDRAQRRLVRLRRKAGD